MKGISNTIKFKIVFLSWISRHIPDILLSWYLSFTGELPFLPWKCLKFECRYKKWERRRICPSIPRSPSSTASLNKDKHNRMCSLINGDTCPQCPKSGIAQIYYPSTECGSIIQSLVMGRGKCKHFYCTCWSLCWCTCLWRNTDFSCSFHIDFLLFNE